MTSMDRTIRADMTSGIEIDRCVCFDLRFEVIQNACRERPRTFTEIAEEFGCGSSAGCGFCQPYIERMLKTGETKFNEILDYTSRNARWGMRGYERPKRRSSSLLAMRIEVGLPCGHALERSMDSRMASNARISSRLSESPAFTAALHDIMSTTS